MKNSTKKILLYNGLSSLLVAIIIASSVQLGKDFYEELSGASGVYYGLLWGSLVYSLLF